MIFVAQGVCTAVISVRGGAHHASALADAADEKPSDPQADEPTTSATTLWGSSARAFVFPGLDQHPARVSPTIGGTSDRARSTAARSIAASSRTWRRSMMAWSVGSPVSDIRHWRWMSVGPRTGVYTDGLHVQVVV
ncbi:hypothetical protein B0H11DRAFT_1933667 [Mycena galericulata]|nr:hypothetical protein B0H11DRAFT_1933667 [Mycena galericulata]